MLTALRGVISHEDAPRCLFSKEVWKGLKGVGRVVFGAFRGYLVGLRGCGGPEGVHEGIWGSLGGL